jgi:hypothetical protein
MTRYEQLFGIAAISFSSNNCWHCHNPHNSYSLLDLVCILVGYVNIVFTNDNRLRWILQNTKEKLHEVFTEVQYSLRSL